MKRVGMIEQPEVIKTPKKATRGTKAKPEADAPEKVEVAPKKVK